MFDNVVVGVGGRQGGRDAIALAQRLAARNARITLAHVYGGTTIGGRASALAVPLELEASEHVLARAAAELGSQARTELVCESSVGRGLHELAERLDADLLVVGSCHRRCTQPAAAPGKFICCRSSSDTWRRRSPLRRWPRGRRRRDGRRRRAADGADRVRARR
jgi:nucleotide-binding universal stress UspA family protein